MLLGFILTLFQILQPPGVYKNLNDSITQQVEISSDNTEIKKNIKLSKQKRNIFYKNLYHIASPRSYVSLPYCEWHYDLPTPTPNGSFEHYILSADINPQFFFLDEEFSRFSFSISSRVKLRMLDTFSLPIRTPSYMPGITFYWSRSHKNSNYKNYNKIGYITLKYTHHSNGQDDCAKNGYVPDPNNPNNCIPSNQVQTNKYLLNQRTGNFATDMLDFGWNWGGDKESKTDNCKDEKIVIANIYSIGQYLRIRKKDAAYFGRSIHLWYLGYQQHLRLLSTIEPEIKGRYGLNNILAQYQYISSTDWCIYDADGKNEGVNRYEFERVIIRGQFNLSDLSKLTYNHSPINQRTLKNILRYRLSFDISYHISPRKFQSSVGSLFISAGYQGQDDYNIYLERSFPYIKFGLATGLTMFKINR